MHIFKESEISIPDIVSALKAGAVVVYPTETCYGLGCDATNNAAVQKIFDIKHRQQDKSVLVIASDIPMMIRYVEWNQNLEHIAERYWPGPVTVVTRAQKSHGLPEGVIAKDGTIAFRITAYPLAASLSGELGVPIVSTSANISEHASPYNISAVLDMFADAQVQPDIIIDAGELPYRSPSTVIRVGHKHMYVLRQGEVIVDL